MSDFAKDGCYGALEGTLSQPLVQALQQTACLIALYDADDNLLFGNAAFARCFLEGMRAPIHFRDILRHGHASQRGVKVDCGDVERFIADVCTRRRSVPYRAFQTDLLDGTWLWMTETVLDDGHFLTIGSDITALKHEERRLRQDRDSAMHDSLTDALTGLPNRRKLMARLQLAAEQCASGGQPLALALIDLDRFKAINDNHGHEVGDEVLRSFASYCNSQIAPPNSFGRLGGEEFLLIMPGSDVASAAKLLERLRQALPSVELGSELPPLRYTFSAGVAAVTGNETPSQAMRRADHALYAAKAHGRDRILFG